MVSVNQKVRDLIEKDLAVQKDLFRELINTRALAKFLIEKCNVKASLDAVISAIRRYSFEKQVKIEDEEITGVFKSVNISTRNNVVVLTLKHNAINKICNIFKISENVKVVVGSKEIKLVVDKDDASEIKGVFSRVSVKNVIKGLGEISMRISEKEIQKRGVLARMANEISLRGVSIQELLICPPEFIILVKSEDFVKTHEALVALTR